MPPVARPVDYGYLPLQLGSSCTMQAGIVGPITCTISLRLIYTDACVYIPGMFADCPTMSQPQNSDGLQRPSAMLMSSIPKQIQCYAVSCYSAVCNPIQFYAICLVRCNAIQQPYAASAYRACVAPSGTGSQHGMRQTLPRRWRRRMRGCGQCVSIAARRPMCSQSAPCRWTAPPSWPTVRSGVRHVPPGPKAPEGELSCAAILVCTSAHMRSCEHMMLRPRSHVILVSAVQHYTFCIHY